MKNSYINFVLTGDNNYVAPLGVCMTSILLNLADDRCARFFVFVEGFTDNDMKRLEDVKKVRPCEVIFINMKNYTHLFSCIDTSKFVLQYVNLVVYYRLLMLDILPDDVDKCFYIDGDMIIDTDLSSLYDKFDNEKIMGAVVEILAMQYRDNILKHFKEWADLKNFQNNPLKYPYFNAGFFLLNVKKAKELNLFKQAFTFLDRHPNPPYADQDTLNYIIGQKYPHLLEHFPPAYNVFCDMHHDIDLYYDAFYDKEDIQEAFNHPKIYHYGGANKPWINRKVRFFYSIWWRYCHLSPWSDLAEPDADDTENINNASNLDNVDKSQKYRDPNNMCLTYKLFDLIPVFKKKIKYGEKRLYIFGIRFFSRKQITPYLKHYRFLGIKFKKLNIQKMFEFRIEEAKNIMSRHFQDLKNQTFCQFDESNKKIDFRFNELNENVDYALQSLRNDFLLQFHNLKDFASVTDEEYKYFLDSKLDKLTDLINDKVNNEIDYLDSQFDKIKNEINLKSKDSLQNLTLSNKKIKKLINTLWDSNSESKEYLNVQIQDLKKKINIINSVFITHQETFLPFKNIFNGKDIAILATGPTLNHYEPIPGVIHIGVNNAYKFEKIELDFLFIQDISGLQDEILKINEYAQNRCQKFYGDVLSMETCAIPESYLIKYGAKRYYTGGMHTPFVRDISSCLLPDFGSVVFAALAFALYTNPKKLYLVGCDCSDTGYFDNNKNLISSSLKGDLPNILKGWQNFKSFANHLYPNTEIISINPVGLKGLFEDIEV